MNYLSVSAIFDPGHVTTSTHQRDDGSSFAVIRFDAHEGPSLVLHIHGMDELDELDAALSQVREFLTNDAARDAA